MHKDHGKAVAIACRILRPIRADAFKTKKGGLRVKKSGNVYYPWEGRLIQIKKQTIHKQMVLAALFFLLLYVGACTTLADVMKAKEEDRGISQIYPVDKDQAFEIAITVFHWEGSDAVEAHQSQGYMLTTYPFIPMLTGGGNAGVWIVPQGTDQEVRVTVVTLERYPGSDMWMGRTETRFHRRFGQAVEIIKEGKNLPLIPPPLKSINDNELREN